VHKVDRVEESGSNNIIRLNIGERIYKLKSNYPSDCIKWMEAFELAGVTARETAASKTKKARNIGKLVEIYKSDKDSFVKHLEGKKEAIIPKGKQWAGVEEVLDASRKLREEFIIVIHLIYSNSLLTPSDAKKE
jgi:hypothetical protein